MPIRSRPNRPPISTPGFGAGLFPGTATLPGRTEPSRSVNPTTPPEGFPATDRQKSRDHNRNLLVSRTRK